ncbi:MAG: DUF3500 domain-containing protein [Chloroflexi bacterium]|nr:DUF3500 domain-containing protein [Chloroflexota bacterium]
MADADVAWQGLPPEPSARYYFRVHGSRIPIDYDVEESLTNNGEHLHAITRDPANDRGMDWLGATPSVNLKSFSASRVSVGAFTLCVRRRRHDHLSRCWCWCC